MIEKSKYLGRIRELVVGENQCGINIEWPLEQQPEMLVGVDVNNPHVTKGFRII